MPLTLDTPLALYSIPAAYVAAFYPMTMKFVTIASAVGYNNLQPRSNTQRTAELLEDKDKKLADRVARMEGAHQNGNEVLPLWIAAVLAGHQAGLSHHLMNIMAAAFLTNRILYNYVYINQSTIAQGSFRSALFFFGLTFPMTLLFKAANTLRVAGA